MKTFLVALVLVGIGVFGMCVSIIFRKNGHFPHYDVGSNEEMRARGIRCFKDEDAALHGRMKCDGNQSGACETCKLYRKK